MSVNPEEVTRWEMAFSYISWANNNNDIHKDVLRLKGEWKAAGDCNHDVVVVVYDMALPAKVM